MKLVRTEREYLAKKGIPYFKSIEGCGKRFDIIIRFYTFEYLSNPKVWSAKEPSGGYDKWHNLDNKEQNEADANKLNELQISGMFLYCAK